MTDYDAEALRAYWLPFTPNRQFKADPLVLTAAKGMYYTDQHGQQVLDGVGGLWCVNAGHGRPEIAEAIAAQVTQLDYPPAFMTAHPGAIELATRLAALFPGDLNRAYFVNSGSEAVDTALKIALAWHRARGEGQRQRFIGRQKAYHGVGFGGIAVGGIAANKAQFGASLPAAVQMRDTLDLERNAFSIGQPSHGAEFADELERLLGIVDPSTVAACIVEPVSGGGGVIPPPVGYLERLREICDAHGILLIFDEVICAYGRLGAGSAAERFGVLPDLLTSAKGLTNGNLPMGAVMVRDGIYETLMSGPPGMELFHGYTYSGHPVACAAALATLDLYADEGLFARAAGMEAGFQQAVHGLRGLPNVVDIRGVGMVAGVDIAQRDGAPGRRQYEIFRECFRRGLLTRVAGSVIALSPPLIVETGHVETMCRILGEVIEAVP